LWGTSRKILAFLVILVVVVGAFAGVSRCARSSEFHLTFLNIQSGAYLLERLKILFLVSILV
jgi:hypothetical protein